MRKYCCISLICTFSILISQAQVLPPNYNLIPNPGFEFNVGIDERVFLDTSFQDNNNCWVTPNKFPSYILGDNHSLFPRIPGNIVGGLLLAYPVYDMLNSVWLDTSTDHRTYFQTKLLQPLIAGETYYVTIHLGTIKSTQMWSDVVSNIGVYFSDTQVKAFDTFGRIDVTPQIRFVQWDLPALDTFMFVKLTDTFLASGGEQYVTIGNFDHFADWNHIHFSPSTVLHGITQLPYTNLCLDDVSVVRDTNNIISLSKFSLGNDTILCGDSLVIGGEPYFFSYYWNTGDTSRFLTVRDTGTYWCTVDFGCNTYTDTIYIGAPPPIGSFSIADSTVCPGKPYSVHAPPGYNYLWSDLSAADSLLISASGQYWLRISDGCAAFTDTFSVTNGDIPLTSFSFPDTTLCTGRPFTVRGPIGQYSYRWQDGSSADTLLVTAPGQFWLETGNICGSKFIDTFVVTDADVPMSPFSLSDSALCPGEQYVVHAPAGHHGYLWSDGSTADTLLVNTSGTHWLRISNICGSGRTDTFVVRDKHTPIPAFDIRDTTICPGSNLTVHIPHVFPPGAIRYQWSTGDATEFITINTADRYWVTLTDECGIGFSDTFSVLLADTTLPSLFFADTVLCTGRSLTLSGPQGDFGYLWSNGQTTSATTIYTPGHYSLTITHACGNSRSASFEVDVVNDPAWIPLQKPIEVCMGDTATLAASVGFANYYWSTGDTSRVLYTTTAGVYSVSASGKCGMYQDTTEVVVINPPPTFSIGTDTAICEGALLTLQAPPGYTYQWSTGSTEQQVVVIKAGQYSVTVTNACGSQSASISVALTATPQPPLVITGEKDLCRKGAMQPVTLTAMDNGLLLQWSTGATTPQIIVHTPGMYTLTAFNDCGSMTDSVYVRGCKGIIGFPTAFSPNGDGKNDVFRPVVQDVGLIAGYRLQIFDRWGNIVFESTDPLEGWDGEYGGRAAASATYFWQCRIKDVHGEERVEKGDVSLVR